VSNAFGLLCQLSIVRLARCRGLGVRVSLAVTRYHRAVVLCVCVVIGSSAVQLFRWHLSFGAVATTSSSRPSFLC